VAGDTSAALPFGILLKSMFFKIEKTGGRQNRGPENV
jgi:hypothetical protein